MLKPPFIQSIEYTQVRDAGIWLICSFSFSEEHIEAQLAAGIDALQPGDEISTPLPEGDGALEVRRSETGLEKKIGRHGAHGTWSPVTVPDAITWLARGAAYAMKYAKQGYGGTIRFKQT